MSLINITGDDITKTMVVIGTVVLYTSLFVYWRKNRK